MPGVPGYLWLLPLCFLPLHRGLRVQRAPGVPCALSGAKEFMHSSGALRREREVVCGFEFDVVASGATQTPSFRGDAKHRTRNLEIPGLVLRTIPE
jgi:hypothetical protein